MPRVFREEIGGPVSLEVRETDSEVVVSCRAAGLKSESDIQCEVRGRVLTVWRNVDASYEMKGRQQYRKQQYIGHFQQAVLLPAAVVAEKRTMKFKNGMIEIRWPKAY